MLLSRALSPHMFAFTNIQLQMRGGIPFVAPTRELDPFYTVGIIRSLGLWTMSITDTFITNHRDPPFRGSIPAQGNAEMIADFEIYHPLVKRYPNVVGFLRAEPIWNWRSNRVTGLSGFDFRLYSGIRVAFAKPALGNIVNQVRKDSHTAPNNTKDAPDAAPGASPPPVPGPGQPISNADTLKVASKEDRKPSLMRKLIALAKGPDNAGSAQAPITMIQNSANPFGPMIPILTQPPSPVVEADKNANSDLRKQLENENVIAELEAAPVVHSQPLFTNGLTIDKQIGVSTVPFKATYLTMPELLSTAN